MVDTFVKRGYNGSGWDIDFGGSDYLGFFGTNFLNGISPGGFNSSTHKTNSAPTVAGDDDCTPNHCRNVRYVSAAGQSSEGLVSLQEATSVALNTINVDENDCTVRWTYYDTLVNTSLDNCKFFAYDGATPATAPTGVAAVAFEYVKTSPDSINTDRESDAVGDCGAWNAAKGIGGSANALILSDRLVAAQHAFYLGISMSPTSRGWKSGKFRIEMDVS